MAGKARVHELAKELGVTSKEVLAKLKEQGEFVKSASSTVEAPVARRLRDAFPQADGSQGAADGKPGSKSGQQSAREKAQESDATPAAEKPSVAETEQTKQAPKPGPEPGPKPGPQTAEPAAEQPKPAAKAGPKPGPPGSAREDQESGGVVPPKPQGPKSGGPKPGPRSPRVGNNPFGVGEGSPQQPPAVSDPPKGRRESVPVVVLRARRTASHAASRQLHRRRVSSRAVASLAQATCPPGPTPE